MANRDIRHLAQKRQKLLKYVINNDISNITYLLKREPDLVDISFGPPYQNRTILQIACSDENGMERVLGSTILRLIDLGADPRLTSARDHWEALHYAAVATNPEKLSVILNVLKKNQILSLVYCSKFVKERYAWCREKDIPESYSNSALHLVLKYGNTYKLMCECVELLIRHGISLNQKDSNGQSPNDLIQLLEYSKLQTLAESVPSASEYSKSSFECVQNQDFERFKSLNLSVEELNDFDGPDHDSSSCTLLQLCCAKNLENFVEYLLQRGASPNLTVRKNPNAPIVLAMRSDYESIVTMLLQQESLKLPPDILIKLQREYKKSRNFNKTDKYVDAILSYLETHPSAENKVYLNAADDLNRTALHYATYYGYSNVLSLLKMGASLTQKDLFGYTALNYIEPSVFEKFLDSCVELPKDEEDFSIMLHSLRNQRKNFSLEIQYKNLVNRESDSDEVIFESEFLSRMIKIKSLKPYLNHPVVSSYLTVKWQKYKWFYFSNLLLYLVAYFSLLFYGFAFYHLARVSNTILLVSLLLLFVRGFAHICIFNLRTTETYVDILIIIGDIYILAAGWFEELLNQNLLVAFSLVFLLSTMGIFLQLGNLPMFTIKVIILRRITFSFCKYIIFYLFPILAFAFCFYMLAEHKEDHLATTIYETVTMFAGDPNKDFPENFETNPIFGHIIYVVFALLICIVLQNLLVGLAVSDLQEIQKEAEFVDKKERAEYITKIERVVFDLYKRSKTRLFRSIIKSILQESAVFVNDPVLIIQPYNYGRVFTRENPEQKQYINDPNIISYLQNIFKNFDLGHEENEENRPLKTVQEKLERIESLLQEIQTSLKK